MKPILGWCPESLTSTRMVWRWKSMNGTDCSKRLWQRRTRNKHKKEANTMTSSKTYEHLERRPCSNYRQLFVKERKIRAEVLYWQTLGEDPETPEEVAFDYDLPLEAVKNFG